MLKKNARNFEKLDISFDKITKTFLLKNAFFLLFFANYIFVVSHFKIHPSVHLNASKSSDGIVVKEKDLLKED